MMWFPTGLKWKSDGSLFFRYFFINIKYLCLISFSSFVEIVLLRRKSETLNVVQCILFDLANFHNITSNTYIYNDRISYFLVD
jgi:hypothetical protein